MVNSSPTTLITGAAGNLGSLLARHLVEGGHSLRLMYHRKPLPPDLASAPNVSAFQADLAKPETLSHAVAGATEAAILKPNVRGIYHVGDEKPVTLQEFLDKACGAWKCRRPFRTPVWTIYVVAALCELFAAILEKPSPLTRDFITIGRVSHWGDTKRARDELIPKLKYPTLEDGLCTL